MADRGQGERLPGVCLLGCALEASPLARSGDARGNLPYDGPIKGVVDFASISNWNQSGATYKTVIDGMTVSRLRDPGCAGRSTAWTRG